MLTITCKSSKQYVPTLGSWTIGVVCRYFRCLHFTREYEVLWDFCSFFPNLARKCCCHIQLDFWEKQKDVAVVTVSLFSKEEIILFLFFVAVESQVWLCKIIDSEVTGEKLRHSNCIKWPAYFLRLLLCLKLWLKLKRGWKYSILFFRCGYATLHHVIEKSKEDRMESFFLSETCKYLFLVCIFIEVLFL